MKKQLSKEDKEFWRMVRRKTLRSFLWFFLFIVLAVSAWKWLNSRSEDDQALWPLRKSLKANEKVFATMFRTNHSAPEYPKSEAVKNVRVNGDVGMGDNFDAAAWKLQVVRYSESVAVPGDTLYLTLDEIK